MKHLIFLLFLCLFGVLIFPSNALAQVLVSPEQNTVVAREGFSLTWATITNKPNLEYVVEISAKGGTAFESAVVHTSPRILVQDPTAKKTESYVVSSGVVENALRSQTPFYWRVRAYQRLSPTPTPGSTPAPPSPPQTPISTSTQRSFIPAQLFIPLMESPRDKVTVLSSPVQLVAKAQADAKVRFQLSTSSTFAALLYDKTLDLSTPAYPSIPLSDTTTYYWRTMSVGVAGATSVWSPTHMFVSADFPTAPVPYTPANNAWIFSEPTIQMQWRDASSPPVNGYELELSTKSGSNFSSGVFSVQKFSPDRTYTVSIDWAGKTDIYWRVRGKTSSGVYGAWSAIFKFSVFQVPTQISPANGVQADYPITFQWTPVTRAKYYEIQIGNRSPEDPFGYDDVPEKVYGTSFGGVTHHDGVKGYWRVRAIYDTGLPSAWSPTWSYTGHWPKGAPSYPTAIRTSKGTFPDNRWYFYFSYPVRWTESTYIVNIEACHIQVSKSSDFSTRVVDIVYQVPYFFFGFPQGTPCEPYGEHPTGTSPMTIYVRTPDAVPRGSYYSRTRVQSVGLWSPWSSTLTFSAN